jgi:cytochrome c oxidase subunit 2
MRPMTFVLERDADIPAVAAYVAALPPRRPAPTLQGADPGRGRDLYSVCIACHGPDGAGMEALKAPPLNHASDWYLVEQLKKYRAGVRGADPRDANGLLMRPMAAQLPDDQALLDVVAHIGSLPAPAAQPRPQ